MQFHPECAVPLPIISSPLYIRHWYMSCEYDDSFQSRSGWNSMQLHPECAVPLPIISSPLYIRHWYTSCKFDEAFKHLQDGTPWSSILNVLESCYQTFMTYTSAECTVEN